MGEGNGGIKSLSAFEVIDNIVLNWKVNGEVNKVS